MSELNPVTWRSDIQAALDADKAADWAEIQARHDAEMAHRLGVEAAETEARNAASAAIASEYQTATPPEYVTLELNGLSPARAMLLRYVRWVEVLRDERSALEAGRERFLAAQGVPSMTRKALAQLIADDTSGLVALMAAGGDLTKHQTRAAERKRLEAKLKDDEHSRDVAVGALAEVEGRLDALEKQIEVIVGRHQEFVAAVIEEHLMLGAAATQTAQLDALRDTELTVLGGYAAIQSLRGLASEPRHHRIALPSIRTAGESWVTGDGERPGHHIGGLLSGHAVELPVHEQRAEQNRWLDLAHALMADPHAQLGD